MSYLLVVGAGVDVVMIAVDFKRAFENRVLAVTVNCDSC